MKKKVLFVVEAMGGGVFTYIVDLANQLIEEYDLYIAYAMRPQTPKDIKMYFDNRVKLIEIKSFTRSINVLKDWKTVVELKKLEKSIQPDIIHLHSSKAGALGRLIFNGKKVALFYTPHAYSFLMADYGKIKRNIFRMIEAMLSKTHSITISCSNGEHNETLKLTKNAELVNNGVNIREIDGIMNSLVKSDEKIYKVFTLGRICEQKNPELFNELALSMPNEKFLWIGDGNLKHKLTSPNITISGWVNRKKALELASECEVFILTSVWEGLPISLLESMYLKKICVVSDVIGNRDVISNGINGYLCNTTEDFIRAINSDEHNSIIVNAYNDILNKYNVDLMKEKYSNIYKKYMKGSI